MNQKVGLVEVSFHGLDNFNQMGAKMTVNSFFAGIGGFDLGFESAGFSVRYQCEINDFCNDVLENHWPDVKRGQDIREIKPNEIPEAVVWCGGFPCQDVSVARGAKGRAGLKGENSGLFYDFLDLVEKKKPEVILIENVTGLLSSHLGHDFRIVIQSLTKIGYGVSWRVLNTRYFGAPQSRPRVYICAWKGDLEKAVYALHENEGSTKPSKPRDGFLKASTEKSLGVTVPEIAYCLAATSGRHTGTDWSRTYISYENRVRRITPTEAERLQGFPTNWTIPLMRKNSRKDIDSLRYHAAGNAVSVPTVSWIANRIKKAMTGSFANSNAVEVKGLFKDFETRSRRHVQFPISNNGHAPLISEDEKIKWFSGGMAIGKEFIHGNIYSCPSQQVKSKLIDIIDQYIPDDKYFLSRGAAVGILRRVNGQGRVLFPPLRAALEKLSSLEVING